MVQCIWINVAHNRHQNGSFEGKLYAVQIGEVLGISSPLNPEPCDYIYEEDKIYYEIGGVWITVYRKIEWYGNWCWDRIAIDIYDVTGLLQFLKQQMTWDVDMGDEIITSLFENGNIKPDYLVKAIKQNKKERKEEAKNTKVSGELLELGMGIQKWWIT